MCCGSKIITKYIFSSIPEFKIAKVIESVFDVAEVALPEELELLGQIETIMLDMYHGTVGDPQLKGNTYVYDLVMHTKELVNHFYTDDIVNKAFDEIAEMYVNKDENKSITKEIFSPST